MKTSIIDTSKQIVADRPFIASLSALILLGVVFCLYVVFNIHATELQVVTHYSAFGQTNFYRDKWYYLLSFILFGLLTVVIYGALACKLFVHKGRALALPFAWLGIASLVLAIAIVYQVLKIAALS